METKRILITGSSGYLGQHLLHSLLSSNSSSSNNHEIYALFNSSSTFEQDVSNKHAQEKSVPSHNVKFTLLKLDLTNDEETVKTTIQNLKPHVCIHLAAISSPAIAQRNPDLANALNCPQVLFTCCKELGAQIIALSTDQVYDGDKKCNKKKRVDNDYQQEQKSSSSSLYLETDEAKPVNIYGQTKINMEQYLQTHLPTTSVSLRSSIIMGPHVPYGNCKSTFLHFIRSRMESNAKTTYWMDECRNVISVYDMIQVIMWFVQNGITSENAGIYNVGGKDSVSRYDMALDVIKYFGGEQQEFVEGLYKSKEEEKKAGNDDANALRSPLDISMDSSKVEGTCGFTMKGMGGILMDTFPKN